jgi:hypothetical protein
MYFSLMVVVLVIRIVVRTIPKPESGTRAVLEPKIGEVLPGIKGAGGIDLLCGNLQSSFSRRGFSGSDMEHRYPLPNM